MRERCHSASAILARAFFVLILIWGSVSLLRICVRTLMPPICQLPLTPPEREAAGVLSLVHELEGLFKKHAIIDKDQDGKGEYGTLNDLRRFANDVLEPIYRDAFNSYTELNGWELMVFIPTDVNHAEKYWCCYAWSIGRNETPLSFVVTQDGLIHSSLTKSYGKRNKPKASDAFVGVPYLSPVDTRNWTVFEEVEHPVAQVKRELGSHP